MRRIVPVLILALVIWLLWANTAIEVNEWTIESADIPEQFGGFRIAQVSDLHNTEFGRDNERLLKLLRESEPDIIVITGDLIDSRNTDLQIALAFAEKAVQIAPCYYVSGNHESRISGGAALRQGLLDAGVTVLEDRSVTLERSGGALTLVGLADPDFRGPFVAGLREMTGQQEGCTILLSHRPEYFELYADCGVDLVFSGHAHGGQVRLPFVGGLIAPGQGLFPEYDSGLYRKGDTVMLVSRGLGNSIVPLRVNDRPEILVAVLKRP